jgi:hypothetical protein
MRDVLISIDPQPLGLSEIYSETKHIGITEGFAVVGRTAEQA